MAFVVLLSFANNVLLIIADRPDMRVGKILQSEAVIASAIRKNSMRALPKMMLSYSI
jgi:hypothetical protein